MQHLERARWEKGTRKKKVRHLHRGGGEEGMSINICDSIHEEICLHCECHFSTLSNLQHQTSPSALHVWTPTLDSAAFSASQGMLVLLLKKSTMTIMLI